MHIVKSRFFSFACRPAVVLLLLVGHFAPAPARASWRAIDSPAFLTDGNPHFIEQSVAAGDVFRYLAPALMYGLVAKNLDLEGFWQASLVLTTSLGSMFVLKRATMRQRPNGGLDYKSFPSGHTTAAMAPAAFVTLRYGFWESIPFWGMGIFTAYSRVAGRKHYITDNLGATGLALFFAYIFVTPFDEEKRIDQTALVKETPEKNSLRVLPITYDNGGLGLGLAMNF